MIGDSKGLPVTLEYQNRTDTTKTVVILNIPI